MSTLPCRCCLRQLATAYRAVEEGMDVQSVTDEEIREILSNGITYLYRVTDPPLGLQQLILSIVEERRNELLEALRKQKDADHGTNDGTTSASN